MQVNLGDGNIIVPTSTNTIINTTTPPLLFHQVNVFLMLRKQIDTVAHTYFCALRRSRSKGPEVQLHPEYNTSELRRICI